MATKGGRIYFMFIVSPHYPALDPLMQIYEKNTYADGNVTSRFLQIIPLHFFHKIVCAMIYLANYRAKC